MKIIRADIFGFGKWIDKIFHFYDTSLICFYGENESGKTTLQQFLIYMLFGFPPRKRTLYKPKMSSTLGGRLVIVSDSIGQFSIERLNDEVTCYLADGTEQNEAWLQKQLNGMTEEMYRSIYSFSAIDLSGIQEMKDESLGEILFSIGLTGATNIYTVERNIDRKIGELFKPSGRVPEINKQLAKLNTLQTKLSKLEKMEITYRQKKDDQSLLIHRLNKLETDLAEQKEALFTFEKIRHSLPTLQDYHRYEEQLESFHGEMPFPENGVERLNELKKQLIPLQSELELLNENKQKYKQTYDDIIAKLHSDDIYEDALKLKNEKQSYMENKHAYDLINEKLKNTESQINQALDVLDIGLTADDIAKISFPFHSEMTWIELNRENELLKLERDQLQDEEHILRRKQEKLHDDQSVLKSRQLPSAQIESLKTKLNEDKQIIGQLKEQKDREKKWNQTKAGRIDNMKTMLYSSVGIGMISFVIGFIFNLSSLYIVATVVMMFGFFQQFMTKRSLHEMENLVIDKTENHRTVKPLSDNERQHYTQIIEEQESLKNELALLEKAKKELHIEELQLEERNHLFSQKQMKHEQLIYEECVQYPFLYNISVSHWLNLRESLQGIQDNLSNREQLMKQITNFEREISKVDDQLEHFFTHINETDTQTIEYVDTWLQNEQDLLRQKVQYDDFLAEISDRQQKINNEYEIYNAKINDLFKLAKVESEERFLEVANMIVQHKEMTNKKQSCLQQITLTFGEDGMIDVLEEKLNENDVELKITTIKRRIDEIEQDISQNRDQLAQLDASLKQLEQSEDYSEMIHLLEIEQQKLAELTFDWTVLQTAKEALNEAKRSYRNKYLTEVINKTSHYFSLITNKAYIKVFPPTDDHPFLVESADLIRYEVGELSQGTVDQLYVSLRLAISEVMSERYNVPFIIDDAFVHFDATRTENIIDVLLKIGEKQQIFFFTCKNDIKQFMPKQMVQQIDESISVS